MPEQQFENRNGNEFYFSPNSILWKVNREQILLLGGARALLMQIAHPLVAEAVAQHSSVIYDPVGRLNRTLDLMLTIIFGTKSQTFQTARTVNLTHSKVFGVLSKEIGPYGIGTEYSASNPELMIWVWATLVDTAILCYEKFVRPLTEFEKQKCYAEGYEIVRLLGTGEEFIPAKIPSLYSYIDNQILEKKVVVSKKAKEVANLILDQSYLIFGQLHPMFTHLYPTLNQFHPLMKLATLPYTKITAGLLPKVLRAQYGFSWSPLEDAALESFAKVTRRVLPLLPEPIRFVPHYRKAKRLIETEENTYEEQFEHANLS